MSEKYTINIEPVKDHLVVTVPELGITVETTGTTRQEAVDVGTQAITNALLERKRRRRRVLHRSTS